jgi:L-gulonolactone oxidase
MRQHLFQLFLRQYIEHKNPANLHVHVWSNAVLWISLCTLLSRITAPATIPLLGANLGGWWIVASVIYWLRLDVVTPVLVLLWSVAFASLPLVPWGPQHGWIIGVAVPLVVFTLSGLVALFSHIYYHEHAEYLKTDNPLVDALETTHAVLWGPFHFWLCALLRAGYRRRSLRVELDSAERQHILRRDGVRWNNWGRTFHCVPLTICVPMTIRDLCATVRQASEESRKIRMVAGGFTWSSMAATDDILVFCERLNKVEIERDRKTVWAECGATNRQINGALAAKGLQLPFNVVLENVRIAGVVSMGTHGSGKDTGTISDLVEALEVIDASGNLRILSEKTIGAEAMEAARFGLGVFGVIARVQLRVEPEYRVLQIDRKMRISETIADLPRLVREHDSVEVFWFPYTKWAWVRTFDRTHRPMTLRSHGIGFLTRNFFEMVVGVGSLSAVSKWYPAALPGLVGVFAGMLGFHERVVRLTDAVHYRRWVELVRTTCVEVGFKVDDDDFSNFRRVFHGTRQLVDDWTKRGKYPFDLTVNIRFVGSSRALLSPAYGPGLTCYIEALFARKSAYWKAFTIELFNLWVSANPGALPHWAKEFEHVPGIDVLAQERLGARLTRFRAALKDSAVDPRGMFVNDLVRRVFGF